MIDLSNENVIHIKKDGMEYIQFRKLLEYKEFVNHAYSLNTNIDFRTEKIDKIQLDNNEYEKIMDNYNKFCKSFGSNYKNVIKPIQTHTNNIKIVNEKINKTSPDIRLENYKDIDGLITNKRNLVLTTTNADCILFLFFDPVKKVIASVHSGWRGTIKKISVKTVEKMKKTYGCNPKDIICCICPSIRKCHFEVDKDVKDIFEKEFLDILTKENNIIEKQEDKDKWNIDTIKINKIILERSGLKKENIIDSKICSVCNSNKIHSFRSHKQQCGLGVAMIELN